MAERDEAACSTGTSSQKRKNFRWEDAHIEQLIDSMITYKIEMSYKGLDFDADKPAMYNVLRIRMAELSPDDDSAIHAFGPISKIPRPSGDLSLQELKSLNATWKKENDLISKGKNRIIEKVKEIRQNFSKAVTSGTRSGSGKIVCEHYDKLINLWGGCANTTSLPFGVRSADFLDEDQEGDDEEGVSVFDGESDGIESSLTSENLDSAGSSSIQEQGSSRDVLSPNLRKKAGDKRKANVSAVPKLIDDKWKHLQRSLSSAQRDQLLINEAKDDTSFRKELTEAMRESNETFSKSVESMSNSVKQLGDGICRSMEMLSRAI
eukprot:Seg5442.1 transcript_id=Seg5442.1/GoldUCD/mRNA.D3Y31 product="hypothetical protein" protein_id=Seg5442.1/GoldUCD/D3Y31